MTVIHTKRVQEAYERGGLEAVQALPHHRDAWELLRKHLLGLHDQSLHGRRGSSLEAREKLPQGKGDCYQSSLDNFMNLAGDSSARLVHATVMGRGPVEGIRFGHAWVERDEQVDGQTVRMAIDRANGLDVHTPAAVYRALGQAEDLREYTFTEMAEFALLTGHYGPWE